MAMVTNSSSLSVHSVGNRFKKKEKLKQFLLSATLSQWVRAAGGSVATWSYWLSGARIPNASSLEEPAMRLGLTPGELLDIISERRQKTYVELSTC